MKRMKIIVATAVLLAVALAASSCVNTKAVVIRTPDVSAIKDGSYIGDYTVGPVRAKVRVEVRSGRIAGFTILEHRTMMGKKAENLAGLVVERQSLELDAVSGATVSSKAILKAGEVALESAAR